MPDKPIDPVTLDEAAQILGCSVSGVVSYKERGRLPSTERYRHYRLSRIVVEALALEVYRWAKHHYDVGPSWVTGKRAAGLLGVAESRLNQLATRGYRPFETHVDGRGHIAASSWWWSLRPVT